ncbi:hypothetical protein LIER_15362 [Lithospermum erythrorhizon]|uniref:Uncharacterized protein n=1 Tax=Lithospermum erythrorhizon TaxID=34254 RepID=A0AAV3Q418_LITER
MDLGGSPNSSKEACGIERQLRAFLVERMYIVLALPLSHQRLWYTTPWMLNTTGGPWRTFKELWIFLSNQLTACGRKDALSQIACILWCLWKSRNGVVFENISASMENIIQHGINLATDFQQATGTTFGRDEGRGQVGSAPESMSRWKPPQQNFIKINCDAGWRCLFEMISLVL